MREPGKSRISAWRRLRAACAALGRDRDGSAFFYTTISLPVLVGFALLAIDGSRLMNLHSHLQHGADGLALAAAGELNHKNDSLKRAKLAIQELIQNNQRFGDAGWEIIECPSEDDCDVTGRFLTSLPPDDAISISDWIDEDESRLVANLSENLNNHPRSSAARFVEITVKPQGLTTLMPAAFIGASSTAAATATAVAGYTRGVCYFTPMMMCNPFEGQTPDLYDAAATPEFRRKMIEIRQTGPNSDYFPGNFAFLRNDSIKTLREALGRVDPGTCFVEDGVDTEPGQSMGQVSQGLNVRFDIYSGPMNKSNPEYRPSLNVRKGFNFTGDACNAADGDDNAFLGLPRDLTVDETFEDGSGNVTGRIYTGEWDEILPKEGVHAGGFEGYWHINYGHADIDPPNGWDNSDANRPSRYEVYRYEIETMLDEDPSNDLVTNQSIGGETGTPMCYTGGTLADDPDRRVLHAAVVNCRDPAIEPYLQGHSEDIPVYAFAKFFLIHPLDPSGPSSIDVEVVEVVAPPTDYQARDTVQLYR